MKRLLLLTVSLMPLFLFGQTQDSSKQEERSDTTTNTYAIIVGISTFQHENILPLPDAAVQAQAFADSLLADEESPLLQENLKLLLNEEATLTQIMTTLVEFWSSSKEGDQIILYLNTWRAAERQRVGRQGEFYLAWDSPPYTFAAGAINYPVLGQLKKQFFEQTKVTLILKDECQYRFGSFTNDKE